MGRTLIPALCSVSLAACGSGLPFGGKQAESSALQASVGDAQARAFYHARGWKDAWDKKSEKQLLKIIAAAPANGLKPNLFLKVPLPKEAAAHDAALTSAALRYASALASGYADPKKIRSVYTIPRPKVDVATGLAKALDGDELEQWFASLPPQSDEYRALSEAHLHFLELAAKDKPADIPPGKPIRPGHRDQRVPFVAAALIAEGYLPAPPQQLSQHYSREIAAAVRKLQADFGIKPDGIVGDSTLDALNLGPAGLARQLAINMERLRWLDRTPPPTRIDVNTAAASLDYWRDGKHLDRRNVIVGEPDKQTPQLQASFKQLVANPKWRVPDSIGSKELANEDPGWLQRNNFSMEDGRYVQESGPKNSLGLVKFDMQDPQQIYLHDTPAKALFALPDRHRSHGCIRVQDALQFAAMLASQDGVDGQLQKALASGDETWVKLKTEIPVRLFYHTAFLGDDGVRFRPDVYGWDDDVAMALGLVRGAPRRPWQQQGEDIGP